MNGVGLPGTGFGGYFYIFLGLIMPFIELYQTIRGRSSFKRWKIVLRQLAIALLILAGVEGSYFLVFELFGLNKPTALVIGNAGLATGAFIIAPLVLSLSVLILVITGIRIWALVEKFRSRGGKESDPSIKTIKMDQTNQMQTTKTIKLDKLETNRKEKK